MRLFLLFLCCLALPAHADADLLQHCLKTAERRQLEAIDLAKDCPKLLLTIRRQGTAVSFEPPLAEGEVSVAQLQFLQRSEQIIRSPNAIDQAGLEQLLAEILQPEAPDPEAAWWKALTSWLEKLKSGDYEGQYQWLLRFLRAITPSEQVALAFLYGSLALMVIASLWVVIMELYHAGIFDKRGIRRHSAASAKMPDMPQQAVVSHVQSELAVPQQQLAALLNSVVAGLAAKGMLPVDATLTHRQLARYIGEHAPQAAEAFMRLVRCAEPVLYGKHKVSDEMLRVCRDDADSLLGNVSA